MGRWEPNGAERLVAAAIELYDERGFEQTTVAEIAKRAGLTERTFFRHFADKREVLFAGGHLLEDRIREVLAAMPAPTAAIDAVHDAIVAISQLLEERPLDFVQRRFRVIAANPELLERERLKLAALSAALANGLKQRGIKESAATIAAEIGIAIFHTAFTRWIEGSNRQRFSQIVDASFDELKEVAAGR